MDAVFKVLETLPLVGFVLVMLKVVDLQTGTLISMAFSGLTLGGAWLCRHRLRAMQTATLAAILIFGTLTLLLQDQWFIKLKTTVINLIFSLIFAGSHVVGDKTLLERLLGKVLPAPAVKLRRLNTIVAIYFAGIAGLNFWLAQVLSDAEWATFKVLGIFGMNLLLIIGAGLYLRSDLRQAMAENNQNSNV